MVALIDYEREMSHGTINFQLFAIKQVDWNGERPLRYNYAERSTSFRSSRNNTVSNGSWPSLDTNPNSRH